MKEEAGMDAVLLRLNNELFFDLTDEELWQCVFKHAAVDFLLYERVLLGAEEGLFGWRVVRKADGPDWFDKVLLDELSFCRVKDSESAFVHFFDAKKNVSESLGKSKNMFLAQGGNVYGLDLTTAENLDEVAALCREINYGEGG